MLVTGASRGIGAGIARELLDRGCHVGCGYRTGGEAIGKLAADHPGQVLPVRVDLGDEAGAPAAVQSVLDTWGRLDAVILNAGRWQGGRLTTMDPAQWWQVIELNLRGNAALARAALPALTRGHRPSVVLVSSVVGLIGHPGDTAYASAKAAMIGFARSLAKEVGRDGIRVNVLAPGFVDTDMTAAVPDRSRQVISDATLLGRFGTVAEIARAAVFLSEDATFCTGSVLSADGGWSI